jgi:flagellar protein FlaG
MNPISNYINHSNALPLAGSSDSASVPKHTDVDTKVVSKVISSTELKPSNVVQNSQPTREVVAKAAEQIQSFVSSMGRNLSFSVDPSTGYHVVTVVNPENGEIIRQLPSEELLKIAQTLGNLNNALVSQKA